jgi:parallel beta-helix repeat protein
MSYDTEAGYDYVYSEYRAGTGDWQELSSFDGQGSGAFQHTVPAANHNGTVQFRFRFDSEGGFSDEDGLFDSNGAVVFDDIVVSDGTGVIDEQDFETETVDDLTTVDGDWQATQVEGFGIFGALEDGATVLQEDPGVTNSTYLWGFFNGSPDTYECGGHPEQAVVPFGVDPAERYWRGYMWTLLQSPWLDLTQDDNGLPVTSHESIALVFDAYRDLPLDNVVGYGVYVRWMDAGCPSVWTSDGLVYQSDTKDWYRQVVELVDLIAPGMTEIQVAIVVRDLCYNWCGTLGSGACHSHAPLIDNIAIEVRNGVETHVVTNTNDTGPGSLRQAIEDANVFQTASRIEFDIPGDVPHTIAPLSTFDVMLYPTDIDGTSQPGYSGDPVIVIDGTYSPGAPRFIFESTGSMRGLRVDNTTAGVVMYAAGSTVEKCDFNHNEIGIRIDGDGSAVIDCRLIATGDNLGFDPALRVSADGCTVEGCEIQASYKTGILITGSNNTVQECILEDNIDDGIRVIGANNTIGGADPAMGNVLRNNRAGIWVSTGTGNSIRSNSISGNDFLGIELWPSALDGSYPDVNDPLDADTGPNNYQNYPVISYGDADEGVIYGSLQSAANTTYEIDFFAGPTGTCDGTGYGEGERFLGSATVVTGGNGVVEFDIPVEGAFVFDDILTATATDPDGNTSEFSPCYSPGVITVYNTNDSGVGSLLQAVLDANANADVTYIHFDIPGPGPHVIAMSQEIAITEQTIIDGYTQPGASPNTNSFGSGSNATPMIVLEAVGTTGVGLSLQADGCVVRGLVINSYTVCGIDLVSNYNRVEGCFIGTDYTGASAAPNGAGIIVEGDKNVIGGSSPAALNVISGNLGEGVSAEGVSNMHIEGNVIGVDASSSATVSNGGNGVYERNCAFSTIVNNVLSGNKKRGYVNAGVVSGTQSDITDNLIGVGVDGELALGNTRHGIEINIGTGSGGSIHIGDLPGDANIIAYNAQDGVRVNTPDLIDIRITSNVIHHNDKGVVVRDGMAAISKNSIYANTLLGIDLDDDGPDANDPLDADTGPNGFQNYPVLTAVSSGSIRIQGDFEGAPSTDIVFEFFASADCSGGGVGEIYLGEQTYSTDALGNATIDVTLPVGAPGGYHISATARPLTGGGTSEFSGCVPFNNTPDGTDVPVTPVDVATLDSPVDLTFETVTVPGNTYLDISATGPALPSGFMMGTPPAYYDITTDATILDSITVCITYDEAAIEGEETELVLWHYDTSLAVPDWVNATRSRDTVNNVICGRTASLSPFILAYPDPASGIYVPTVAENRVVLHQNVPNPFNPTTQIRFNIPVSSPVSLVVYNVHGQRVRTLVSETLPAGEKTVEWNGRDESGRHVSTGIYFYRLVTPESTVSKKMVLLK